MSPIKAVPQMLFVLLSLLLLIPNIFTLREDYFWREYLGSVPSDAFQAGQDIDGNSIYIAQVYVKNTGLLVGRVVSGQKQVQVSYGGVVKTGKFVKVLCGLEDNFYWMQANSSNLHVKVIDKHPVVGGHDDYYGLLNIGRISVGGDTKVGKVASFWVENAFFYHEEAGGEKRVASYEVLMYKKDKLEELV